MSPTFVAVLIGCALWALAERPRGELRAGKLDLQQCSWAAMVFATGGIASLASFNVIDITPDLLTLFRVIPAAIVGLALITTLLLHRTAKISHSGLLLVAFFGLLATHAVDGQAIFTTILSLAVFLPAIIVAKTGYDLQSLMIGAKIGILSTLATIFLGTLALRETFIGLCRFDKCSFWGESLGAQGAGNALGMVLAVFAGVSLATAGTRTRFMSVAVGSWLLVDATSSRSALLALAVSFGVAIAYHLSRLTRRRGWLAFSLAACTGLVVLLPLQGWSGPEFTGRAYLWNYALELVNSSPVAGYGASFWVSDAGSQSLVRNYSTHNLFTEILISAGFAGLIVLAWAIFATLRQADFAGTIAAMAMFTLIIGSSLSEVVCAPGRTYLFAGAFAFAFVISHAKSRENDTSRIDNMQERRSQLLPSG